MPHPSGAAAGAGAGGAKGKGKGDVFRYWVRRGCYGPMPPRFRV